MRRSLGHSIGLEAGAQRAVDHAVDGSKVQQCGQGDEGVEDLVVCGGRGGGGGVSYGL